MPVTPYCQVAFRCRNCGRLHTSEDAGEHLLPTKCRVCDKGEWEVLADADPERLEELGISPDDVISHTPANKEEGHKAGITACDEGIKEVEAKRNHWQENQDSIVKEFKELDQKITEMDSQIEDLATTDIAGWQHLMNERDKCEQRLKELQALEPTSRDDAREEHLKEWKQKHQEALSGKSKPTESRRVLARAADGSKTREKSKNG